MNWEGFAWKSRTGATDLVEASQLTGANWGQTSPKSYQLELLLKRGGKIKYDGFTVAVC